MHHHRPSRRPPGPRRVGARGVLGLVALAALVALPGGCDAPESTGDCGGKPCEIPLTVSELETALQGHADPVAAWLRDHADASAGIGDDFESIVASVGSSMGCSPEQQRSFVVLSNLELAPKAVVTHCSDVPTDASRLLTIFEPTEDGNDLDGDRFRMAAWDDDAHRYRRYQITPHPQGGLGVAVEPDFCEGCHASLSPGMAWAPIMNEMTNPWAQWNAEPGFESVLFDDARVMAAAGEVFERLTREDLLDSASNLEPVIRSAIDRVTAAQIERRDGAADLQAAEDLLRPVFCDTSVNYVSEVHDSGEIKAAAILDPAIRRLFAAVAAGDWRWLRDDMIRMAPPTAEVGPVRLVAVRGELPQQTEAALVSRQVLSADEVLRVRAIDWTHPMGSDARCELFESALQRAREGGIDLAAAPDVSAVVRSVFEAAMTLPSGQSLLGLGDRIVAIPDADDATAAGVLHGGDPQAWTVSIQAWAEAIEAHFDAFETLDGRRRLHAEAVRRGCLARLRHPIAPIIPGTETCP